MFTHFPNSSVCASLLLLGLWAGSPATSAGQTITSFSPSTAAPGETVTIFGQDLGNIKSVMLHGLPVAVKSGATATTVQVIVPRAAATGCLRLTTSKGTVLTATKLGITRQSSAVSYAPVSGSSVSPTASGKYSTPTMSDLDKDGRVELLVGQGDGTIQVFEQTEAKSPNWGVGFLLKNSDGTPLKVIGGPNNTTTSNYAKPTLTDLNGDGLLELLVGEETGNVWRYEQTPSADPFTFTRVSVLFKNPYGTTTPGRPNAGSYPRPTVADLDNDGLLDVVVGSNDGTLRRYEQTAPNATSFNTLGQLKDDKGVVIDAGSVDKPLLTDYNGDGYLDMLLGNESGTVVLYTQTGSDAVAFKALGNLTTNGTTFMSMSSNGGFSAPAVTDIDGDGLLDLYVGNGAGTVMRFQQTQSATTPVITAPLPVVLASFSGQASAAGNQLSWTTASELHSAYFAVERSTAGVVFSSIGQVAASGTSATAHTYQYLDAAAPAGTSYYRLRQVDQDGTTTYSPVVVLAQAGSSAAAAGPQVFPTVFAQELSVALTAAEEPQLATVALLTADGRTVYGCTVPLGATPQPLAGLPALAAGNYLLRIATAAGISTHRVLHQ